MNLSYENELNLAFDKPLQYKDLLLYPAKLPYYSIFAAADDCLDVSRVDEKDIGLLRLPYLEYMYEKSLIDENFKSKWDMLTLILRIELGENQSFDIFKQDGRLYLRVYQRSENYEVLNKECEILKNNFLQSYKDSKISKQDVATLSKTINQIKEKMYNTIMLGSEDFDNIRYLIIEQNDIKIQHFDAATEKLLLNMKEKLRKARQNKSSNTTFEDLLSVVSYLMNKRPEDLEDMTIRRFNRYLDIAISKDDYYMYKKLELSGSIKMKQELPHWIKHYEPKGKFDDILVKDSGLMTAAKSGKI